MKVNQAAADAIRARRRRLAPVTRLLRDHTNVGRSFNRLVSSDQPEAGDDQRRARWEIRNGDVKRIHPQTSDE